MCSRQLFINMSTRVPFRPVIVTYSVALPGRWAKATTKVSRDSILDRPDNGIVTLKRSRKWQNIPCETDLIHAITLSVHAVFNDICSKVGA